MTTSLIFPCGLIFKSSLAQCIIPLDCLERMNLLLISPWHGQPALMERSKEADGKNLDCFCSSCTCFVKWLIPHPSHQHYCRRCADAARQWPVASLKQLWPSKAHVGWLDQFLFIPAMYLEFGFLLLWKRSHRRTLDSCLGFCLCVCMCMWCSYHMYLTFTNICNRF